VFAPPFDILKPNGGEAWGAGTVQDITWEPGDTVATPEVRLGLHKADEFVDWIVRRTENDGLYKWVVPTDLECTDSYTIRLQSYTDSELNDLSDGPFAILPLTLTAPNGGETWQMGSVQALTWLSNADAVGADVRLGLHQGLDFLDWIVRRTANDGRYSWLLPTTLEPDVTYRIRVQSYTDAAIKDYGDFEFAIERAPLLLTSPTNGDSCTMGATWSVTWESNSPAVGDDVRLGLHKGGAFLDWIVRKMPNDGEYTWQIPGTLVPGYGYRLRLQSYTDSSIRNMSPAFTMLAE